MNKKTIKILKYLFFLALAITLMYIAFKSIDFDYFIDGLRNVNYWLVALSVIIGIAGYVFRVLRWKILIDSLGYNVSPKNVYNATMIGYLANFTIPRIGEVIRCSVLKKTDKIDFEKTLGTVIVERCYDLIFLLFFLIFIVIIRFEMFGSFIAEKIYQPLIEKVSAIPIFLIISAIIVIGVVLFLFFYIRKRINKIIKGLISGLKTGIKMKNYKKFLVYTILIYLCYWLTGFLVLKATPTTLSLNAMDALFLFVIGAFGWVIPAQGGFGSYHILVALGLGVYGISYEDGIVVATIAHESQVIFMILLGFVSLVMFLIFCRKAKNIYTKV
ncbi:MAG: flippase-like domain-containing protein [Prevotellaceae bacterium]|nr:flippase-like domain-containing protein [Prevotellaceae bacterium]